MNYIRFINNGFSVGFCIDTIKYVLDDNLQDYWCIYQSIKNAIDRPSSSDYQDENGYACGIELNGEKTTKSDDFIYVSHNFSINEDAKMGTKSLSLKYVTNILQRVECADDIIRLDSMARVLSENMSNDNIELEIDPLNYKTIAKLINFSFLKEELRAKETDFNYEETIIQQLYMINSFVSLEKRTIIFVDLLWLSQRIKDEIEKLKNCYLVVFVRKYSAVITENNIYIDGFDLEDEQQMYERMMLMSNYYEVDKYIEYIKKEHLAAYCKH